MLQFKNSTRVSSDILSILNVEKILHHEQSEFQEIVIGKHTTDTDRILFLDGNIQFSTFDEKYYHELFVHVPANSIINLKKVLVIGGGDGGLLRELLLYKSIEKIQIVEIDKSVIESCIKFFPTLNNLGKVFSDERVNVLIQDGKKFVENCKKTETVFDLILIDSSDFYGLSDTLITKNFIHDCYKILSPDGFFVMQGGALSIHKDNINLLLDSVKLYFNKNGVYLTSVPSFLCGYYNFIWGGKNSDLKNFSNEVVVKNILANNINFLIYNFDLHKACFALPNNYRDLLGL